MTPLIYAWPGHEPLAAALAASLAAEAGGMEVSHFPDGETYVRLLTAPAGRRVVLACGLERPDEKSTGLYFAARTARELGARDVGMVAPYLAYMRQDARFRDGEAIASRLYARWLSDTVDWLVTLDPHLHRHAALDEIYSIPTRLASATEAIARWIAANVAEPLVVGPDSESEQWARRIAALAGCPYLVLRKQRRGDRDVRIEMPDLAAVRGRSPVLVDDIISTGHTLATAATLLRDAGMPRPACVGVHALFGGGAEQALISAGIERIVTCNSIAHATNAIDVRPDLGRAAREMLDRTALADASA